MTDGDDLPPLSRVERIVWRYGWTIRLAAWFTKAGYRIIRVYDEAMIRWWPYDRWPGEWSGLLKLKEKEKKT